MSIASSERVVPAGPRLGSELESPRTYFDNVVVDNMLDALMELTAAVWTYRDRALLLEHALGEELSRNGRAVDVTALVEAYRPSAEIEAARARERAQLIDAVFGSFQRRPVATRPVAAPEAT